MLRVYVHVRACVILKAFTFFCCVYIVAYACTLIGTGKLFDVRSRKCRAKLEGHEGDVSKVTVMLLVHLRLLW